MLIPEVAPDIRIVDLWERGRRHRTCGYVITSPRLTLVETGASRSTDVWRQSLGALGIAPADVAYVVVTHIHLDHAGGAGTLLRHLPAAQVVVHRRGARHLVDPSRLVASARHIFGDKLEEYFGLPEPVPASRLLVPDAGGPLNLGGGHALRFFDAFGHARHQHMILDAGAGTLFCGDEFGIRYVPIADDYVLPNTPPTQFDPDAMLHSIALLHTLRPEAVLFSHFGRYTGDHEVLSRRLREEVEAFAGLGRADSHPPLWTQIHGELTEHVRRDLAARGLRWTAEVDQVLAEDLAISAQGIADYHERRVRSG